MIKEKEYKKVRHLVCTNLNHKCTGFENGKCKMIKAKCVFQQTGCQQVEWLENKILTVKNLNIHAVSNEVHNNNFKIF